MSTWLIYAIALLAWNALTLLGVQCRARQVAILEDAGIISAEHYAGSLDLSKLLFFLFGAPLIGFGALLIGPKKFALNALLEDIEVELLTVTEQRRLDAAIAKYREK